MSPRRRTPLATTPPEPPLVAAQLVTSDSERASGSATRKELAAEEIVRIALADAGQLPQSILSHLPGGASTREFFRVRWDAGTAIAMYSPHPSQELAKARQSTGYSSFVEVAELLSTRGIRVPRIFRACPRSPVLFVEDLGDVTLARALELQPEAKESLYQLIVRDLAEAQRALTPLPEECVVQRRAFDADLLSWELEHFSKWALAARGFSLKQRQLTIFNEGVHYLSRLIAAWPRVFVHRDFQSRNLMIHPEQGEPRVTWIDFQDAMMGPRVYDLVALLSDSYQVFSDAFIQERLREYCAYLETDEAPVMEEFLLVTVQRKLKDAGRFVFLDRVNGNDHFLRFVEPTIEKARQALERLEGHEPLRRLECMLTEVLDLGPKSPPAHV